MLSDSQVRFFQEEGYLQLDKFVDPARCEELVEHSRKLVESFEPENLSVFSAQGDDTDVNRDRFFFDSGELIRFFFEDEAVSSGKLDRDKQVALNKMGHALHDLDPIFDKFSRTKELSTIAADIGFNDPKIVQSMYIFKPPGIGGKIRIHQDSTYLSTEPQSVVGFLFTLEEADQSNGCLEVIPKAHLEGLKTKYIRKGDHAELVPFQPSPFSDRTTLALPSKVGTLTLLNGLLPHGSGPNRSERSRHGYSFHVVDGQASYSSENWLQRKKLPFRGFK